MLRTVLLVALALTLVSAQTGANSCTAQVAPNFRIGCRTYTRLSATAVRVGESGEWTIGPPSSGDQPAFSRVLIDEKNEPDTLVTNFTLSGIYKFTWTVKVAGCTDKVKVLRVRKIVDNDLLIGLDAHATIGAEREQDMWCKNSYVLSGNVPGAMANMAGESPDTGISGVWTTDTVGVTFTNRTLNTATAQNIPEGNFNTFRWTIDYTPACNSAVDHMLVKRRPPVTGANAGPDANNGCDATYTLAGNAVAHMETGTWSVTAGAGTFADATDPTTGITALGVGTNTFTWTITNTTVPCISSDSVTIIQPAQPVSMAGADTAAFCWKPTTLGTPEPTTAINGPNSVVLAANQALVGQVGDWTQTAGAGAAFAAPAVHNTRVTLSNTVQTNTLQWRVQSQPGALTACTPALDTLDIDVTLVQTAPDPSTANVEVGGVSTVVKNCGDVMHTMDAVAAPAPQTGMWSVVTGTGFTGTGTFVDAALATTVVNGLTPGVNRFRWSHILAGCTGANPGNDIQIIVPPQLVTVDPGASQLQICGGATSLTAPALAPGLTGNWVVDDGTATVTTASSPTTGITGIPTDGSPAYLRWDVNGPGCTEVRSARIILVSPTAGVSAANAGPDLSLNCNEDSIVKMDANLPVTDEEEGLWTVVQGTATFMYPELHDTPVTGIGFGTNIFRWTVRRVDCLTGPRISMDDMTVVRPMQPVANAGPDQLNLCTATVQLAANQPTDGQNGWWTARPNPSAVAFAPADTAHNATATITNFIDTTITLTWTVRAVGNCRARTDTINIVRPLTLPTIVFTAPPLTQNAGLLPTFDNGCQATFTITATPPGMHAGTPNTALWTTSNAGFTIADSSMASTMVTVTAGAYGNPPTVQGGHTFTYTISRPADCVAASNSVAQFVVIIGQNPNTPTAEAGPSRDPWCESTMPGGATGLMATGVAQGQLGTWSGPATIVTPNDPTSTVTGLTVAVHTFTWTKRVTGDATGCPATTDTTMITVPKLLSATVGPQQCLDCGVFSTNVTATAFADVNEFGVWTAQPAGGGFTGAGTIISPGELSTRIDALVPGVNRFIWTVRDTVACNCAGKVGGCSASATVDVVIPVRANAGANQDLQCASGDGTLTGNAGTVCQTGAWTQINQQQSMSTVAITNPASPTSTYVAPEGEFTLRWTLTNQGATTCPTYFDDMIIERNTITTPNAGPDQDIGCGTTATMAGNAASAANGEAGIWSVVPVGGVIFTNPSDPATTVTNVQPGLNRLTWTISKPNQCICTACTPKQDSMDLKRTGMVTPANAGISRHVCGSTGILFGNTPDFGIGTWSTVSGTGTVDNPSSPVTTVSGLTAGASTVFRWSIASTGCGAASTSDATVTRYAKINAGPNQFGVTPPVTLTGSGNATAQVTWSVVSGTGTFSAANSLTTTVTGTAAQNVYRLTFNTCPEFPSDVTVTTIQGPPTVAPPSAAPTTSAPTFFNMTNAPTTVPPTPVPTPPTAVGATASPTTSQPTLFGSTNAPTVGAPTSPTAATSSGVTMTINAAVLLVVLFFAF